MMVIAAIHVSPLSGHLGLVSSLPTAHYTTGYKLLLCHPQAFFTAVWLCCYSTALHLLQTLISARWLGFSPLLTLPLLWGHKGDTKLGSLIGGAPGWCAAGRAALSEPQYLEHIGGCRMWRDYVITFEWWNSPCGALTADHVASSMRYSE